MVEAGNAHKKVCWVAFSSLLVVLNIFLLSCALSGRCPLQAYCLRERSQVYTLERREMMMGTLTRGPATSGPSRMRYKVHTAAAVDAQTSSVVSLN